MIEGVANEQGAELRVRRVGGDIVGRRRGRGSIGCAVPREHRRARRADDVAGIEGRERGREHAYPVRHGREGGTRPVVDRTSNRE
jgi:hypothetical protein